MKLRLRYPKIFCSSASVKCKGADANSFVSFLPIYKLNRNAPQMEEFAGITDEQLEKIKQKVIKEQIFRASAREGWHSLPPEIQMFILKDIRMQLIFNKYFRDHRKLELENGRIKDIRLTWNDWNYMNSNWREFKNFLLNYPNQTNYKTRLHIGGGSLKEVSIHRIVDILMYFQDISKQFKNLVELHLIDFDTLFSKNTDYKKRLVGSIQYGLGHWPTVKILHLQNSGNILQCWMDDKNKYDFPFSCLEECIFDNLLYISEAFSKFLKLTCKTLTSLKMNNIRDLWYNTINDSFEKNFVSIIANEPTIPLKTLHINNFIVDSGFTEMIITVLNKCPMLTELDLTGIKLSQVDIQMIQKKLPSFETKFYFDSS